MTWSKQKERRVENSAGEGEDGVEEVEEILWCQPPVMGYLEVYFHQLKGAGGRGWDIIVILWVQQGSENQCYMQIAGRRGAFLHS